MRTYKKNKSAIAVLILLSCFWLNNEDSIRKTQNLSSRKEVTVINKIDTLKKIVSPLKNNKHLQMNPVSETDIKRNLAIVIVQFEQVPSIPITFQVLDESGLILKHINTNNQSTKISLNGLSNGSYFIKLLDRIIIKHNR